MSEIDNLVDPAARAVHEQMQYGIGLEIYHKHGPQAFASPRALATCHETGHVIVAWAEGVTIDHAEVHPHPVEKEVGRSVARQIRDKGFPTDIWSGFTKFSASPFPSDMHGQHNVLDMDLPTFHHRIRMTLAGLAGELVLYPDAIPAASSIDEKLVSQSACAARARGNHFIAERVWQERMIECVKTIRQHESTARKIVTLFDQKDWLDADDIYSILNTANDNDAADAAAA